MGMLKANRSSRFWVLQAILECTTKNFNTSRKRLVQETLNIKLLVILCFLAKKTKKPVLVLTMLFTISNKQGIFCSHFSVRT